MSDRVVWRAGLLMSMLPAAAAAGVAVAFSVLVPLAGPLLVALVIGVAVANSRHAECPVLRGHVSATRLLLRVGIVMLGLKLPIGDIVSFGPLGIVIVIVTVALTFFVTIKLGNRLGLERDFVTLLASGFSICGAAAIAAVDEAVRAKHKDVALAVAMVTMYGSAMVILVPWISSLLGLTTEQSAVWAGASIHEVAQVVAAASIIGPGALAIATTIKLARVLLLAPTYALVARRRTGGSAQASRQAPWFVIGFGLAAAVRSTGLLSDDLLLVTDALTTFLLAAGMFGLGLGIRAKQLWPVSLRALLLATASTVTAAGVSLSLVSVLI